MRILIGSVTPWEIREARKYGVMGIATNPPVFLGLGKSWQEVVKEAAAAMPEGEFHMQAAEDYDVQAAKEKMLEFQKLLGERLVVKLCLTEEMLSLIPWAHERGIRVNMTCIMTLAQAVVSMQAGADYVSIYMGRAERAGLNPVDIIEKAAKVIRHNEYDCKLIAASISDVAHFTAAAAAGADIAATPLKVLKESIRHRVTDEGIAGFRADWERLPGFEGPIREPRAAATPGTGNDGPVGT